MVDVCAFHHHHLFFHLLMRDGMSACRIGFMSVDSLQFDRLPVDQEIAACQSKLIILGSYVLDFYRPETYLGGYCLDGLPLVVLQCSHQDIDVGLLCRPFFDVFGDKLVLLGC